MASKTQPAPKKIWKTQLSFFLLENQHLLFLLHDLFFDVWRIWPVGKEKTEISNFDIVLPSTNYVEQLGADAKKSSHRNLSNEFCDLMDSIACLPPNDLRSPRKVWYLLAKRTSVTDLEWSGSKVTRDAPFSLEPLSTKRTLWAKNQKEVWYLLAKRTSVPNQKLSARLIGKGVLTKRIFSPDHARIYT